jgi:hypothetical protein
MLSFERRSKAMKEHGDAIFRPAAANESALAVLV